MKKSYLGVARSAALSLAIASTAIAGFNASPAMATGNSKKPIAGAISGGGEALEQRKYDVTFTSFDGTEIAMTIFQPRLDRGQPAPLIMYSHGWGGSRSTSLDETDAMSETARRAWEAGYFVLTFDQRGFGESGGEANSQDPEIEGRDVQGMLDWAEANLAPHLAYLRGDPLVGGLGLSYGGGFQLVGSSIDPRFDALVPVITWHDLSYSLTPDTVPRTAWLSILSGVAATDQAPWLTEAYLESLSGTGSESAAKRLAGHGLGAYCQPRTDGLGVPQVDAFFIQGVNDTLFNINESAWNYNCLRQAGNDAYLLVTTGGHVLPGLQDGSDGGLTNLGGLWNDVQCGDTRYRISDLAYTFLDAKLRKLQREVAIPRVCLTQDRKQGLITQEVPTGGMDLHVESGNLLVGPPSIDVVLNALRKLDPEALANTLSLLSADTASLLTKALTGLISVTPEQVTQVLTELVATQPPSLLAELGTAPRFVPMYRATSDQVLAGLPVADLTIEGEAMLDPRVFVGIGVKRRGTFSPQLLHDQILPLRGTGKRETELAGISTQLRYGDEVGLMLYGFHPQFTLGFSRIPSAVNLKGSVQLPVH